MKLVPQTPLAVRVAALCKRKPTTPWSPKEIQVYRRLVKSGFFDNLDDLTLVEQYYAFERKKGSDGVYRRDLYTYLNNAQGELDRATLWREQHPIKPASRKIIPLPLIPSEPYVAPTDPESIAQRDRFLVDYQAHKKAKNVL